jgi:hypothetical protein
MSASLGVLDPSIPSAGRRCLARQHPFVLLAGRHFAVPASFNCLLAPTPRMR